MTTSPRSRYACQSASSVGISTVHGVHHVAQKFRTASETDSGVISVGAHRGRLSVQSAPGPGSTFLVDLPIPSGGQAGAAA
jgi:hypothetical protein